MKRKPRVDYAYAVGRVRALEVYLVARSTFLEAAEEKDLSSALKIIFDEGQFHQEKIEIEDSDALDVFLEREEALLKDLVSRILLEKDVERIVLGADQPASILPLSQKHKLSFITDFLRHKIDLGNLKVLCRAKYSGLPLDRSEWFFQSGGFVDVKLLQEIFDLSYGEIGEKIKACPYYSAWTQATDKLSDEGTFLVLEREFEDFLMVFLRKAKYIVFGPEPVFAYVQAKLRELQLFRLLGVGKLNQVPGDILKQRMSETYV